MQIIQEKIAAYFLSVGNFTVFCCKSFFAILKPPFRIRIIIEQLMYTGIASISVIAISSVAIGMIFTLQLSVELQKFNAPTLIGNIIGQVFSRELSPIFTTLMLIGKNGSSITAELGAMKLSNQIEALKLMSVDPLHYLVVPRLLAFMCMFPLLSAMSTLVGLGGAAIVSFGLLDVDYAATVDYMFQQLTAWDIITGLYKCFIMSIFVCLICCYLGMQEKRNSNEIALSTTQAVVISSLTIIILDFFLGKLFLIFGIIN